MVGESTTRRIDEVQRDWLLGVEVRATPTHSTIDVNLSRACFFPCALPVNLWVLRWKSHHLFVAPGLHTNFLRDLFPADRSTSTAVSLAFGADADIDAPRAMCQFLVRIGPDVGIRHSTHFLSR